MKMRSMMVVVLVLIGIMMVSSMGMAALPAVGYDPADGMYVKADSDHYWNGRYSDGRVFSEYLAKYLTGSFDNLTNYAVGGAFSGVLTGDVLQGTDRSNWSTWLKGWGGVEQTETFLADVSGVAPSDALYVISVGANDSYAVSSIGQDAAIQTSAANIVTMIDNLADDGATDFVVMLLSTKPGQTEDDFTAAHRIATQTAIADYLLTNNAITVAIVDANNLYEDMEDQGMTAYGLKTWGFYQISDWVPAYGYVYAANDNSSLLPANATEDIYGYGYYYSTDSEYYYTPEAADYDVDEFLYYDEYHLASKTQKHLATDSLESHVATDSGTFEMVYVGNASAFASSSMGNKTYDMVYTFGDSTIDCGRAKAVTTALVNGRSEQSKSIRDMSDASTTAWYTTYVNYALQTGLLNGTTATTFAPNAAMTRAQFVTILGRASDIEDSSAANPATATFADVNTSAYYASHVAWAVEEGIINGTSATTFSPNENISRQDMVKIMGIFADVADIDLPAADDDFTFSDDAKIRAYAKAYVYQLHEAGIIVGNNNAFDPTGDTTRAAATKVLVMLLNYIMPV